MTLTSNLVVGQPIRLGLGLKPLHTKQVQIPLVSIPGQVANLTTLRNGAAHTGNSNVVSALFQKGPRLLKMPVRSTNWYSIGYLASIIEDFESFGVQASPFPLVPIPKA